jgi:uncharacterized membrane protein HdeD (DUF308 family)
MATQGTTVDSRAGGGPAADQQIAQLLAQKWWAFAIRGVLGIIFGLIAFLQPGVTMLSLVMVFSAYAFVDGIFAIVASVRAARQHGKWGFLVLEGIVNIVAAVLTFLWPGITVLSFVFLVGTWAILSGGLMLSAALRLSGDHGRWWFVLGGLASVIYGVLLIGAPFIGALVLTWWLGAYAMVFGFALIAVAIELRARRGEQPRSAP